MVIYSQGMKVEVVCINYIGLWKDGCDKSVLNITDAVGRPKNVCTYYEKIIVLVHKKKYYKCKNIYVYIHVHVMNNTCGLWDVSKYDLYSDT